MAIEERNHHLLVMMLLLWTVATTYHRYNHNLDDDLGAALQENRIDKDSIGLVQLVI